jgi:hypothetical protein
MKNKIFFVFIAVWAVLWAIFIARELFMKGSLRDYRQLLSRPLDGKRSYVTGDRLYDFIAFAAKEVPEGGHYKVVGFDRDPIDEERAAYYLYPRLKDDNGDFVLVYGRPGMSQPGFGTMAQLNEANYILKKQGAK